MYKLLAALAFLALAHAFPQNYYPNYHNFPNKPYYPNHQNYQNYHNFPNYRNNPNYQNFTNYTQYPNYPHYPNGPVIAILRQSSDIHPDGSYEYAYDTENGISAEEHGAQRQYSPTDFGTAAQGSFQYTAPDGTPFAISYVADENGFQPQGAHIPTPPPIPAAIQRSLDYNAAVEAGRIHHPSF